MSTAVLMCEFFAKAIDNARSITKTILVSQNPSLSDVITEYIGERCYDITIEIQNMIEIGQQNCHTESKEVSL